MTLPRINGYCDTLRFPSFIVVDRGVRFYFSGIDQILLPGQVLHYNKHGRIEVVYAHDTWGVLKVTPPWSQKQHKVFIPPKSFLTIACGRRHVQKHETYDDYFRSAVRRSHAALYRLLEAA